jgi:hypothetical protein
MADQDYESWPVYRRLVLQEIADTKEAVQTLSHKLDEKHEENQKMINGLAVNIAMLQVKSGVWGLAGGLLAVFSFLLFEFLKK